MLRDLGLNPEDDPEDTPSVITLRDEDDGAENLATIADLECNVRWFRWIAHEEASGGGAAARGDRERHRVRRGRGSGTHRGDGTPTRLASVWRRRRRQKC